MKAVLLTNVTQVY